MGSSAVEYQDIPQGFEIQQDPSEARFKKAASFTFRPDVEGGYVVDHAGPTNMGLTQKFYDSYAKQNKLPPKNVQDMDPVEIKGVIKSEFFDKAGLGQMPDALAVAMFDYTVNSGVSKAVKDLQKVLGVKQDGVVGQQTLDAIYAHPDEKVLLKGLINERESFMKKLIKDDPKTYKDYENGWRNRINNLRKSLDLSFLNPFHTPEASADEIPAEAPYADIPEGFALGQDAVPEAQPDQYEDIPDGFDIVKTKKEPQGDDLASLLAKDAARYPRPFTKEEVDSYKAGALGALEPFLSRTTDIYKDPDTKEFLEQHPIAKAVGQTARDLALLVPIGKLTAGVVSLPFIPKLAQGVAKMASGTALGKKLFNTMEATRYVAKAVHSGATFGTLAAVKEATIETPDQNLISSAQHIAGNALWGAGLGLVTAAPNYLARVATAGTYGGVTTALSGGDPLDVALNTVLFGGFELISGKSIDRNIKLQAVQNIRRATSEYLAKGGMSPDDAVKMADTAINNSITKAGGLDNVVENNSAPFMNQLASEIQKLKPTWGLSKPKNLPNYAPFESPKPEAPKPTQPQPPAQPQSNAGETMPAPFKSPADAPTSPSAEVLTAPPVDVAADAQKPTTGMPDAKEEVLSSPDESPAEIVPSEQDIIPEEQKNEIIDQNIMTTDKEIEDAQRTIPEQRREEIRQAVEKEENVDYDAAGNIITDFGEKIGGARKDTAKPLGPRVGTTEKERTPSWQKGIITLQDKDGRWRLYKDMGSGRVALISREAFESQEQASSMIPLAVVAHNHRVYTDNREKNTYGIFRLLSNGNRPLVKGGFKTEEEAKKFLALNAAQIIEHKFKFPEKPWLDKVVRKGGRQRANKNVSTKEFQDVFGFRAGEFGNWNMGSDGQAALNHAFDALYDLADTLGVDPKALSLNGRLAIAFGARGHGGEQAARAHYESDKVVINLTKIRGAGTLAHEWFHALDNHIANVDERKQGFATTGFKYNSKLSQDLRNAMKAVVDAMTAKVEDKPIDQDFAKKNSDRALDAFNELVNRLDRNFHYDLSSYRKNFKKPTPAQEAKWSELKNRLLALDVGEKIHVPPKNPRNMLAGYDSFQLIEEMNALYKQVQGNSFSRSDQDSLGRSLYHAIRRYRDYLVRVDEASKGKIESRKSATSYFKESKRIDDFRASQYWSTVEEMAARAFESYVFDKMAQKASQSDYLVHSVDNKLYRALLDMAPYPEGTEREAINKAFDNLMETIDDSILKKAPKQEATQKNKGLIKEQDTPYGDKSKDDQYLDYLKTQRITKEYKNDKSYAADIERQIRKREGGIAEETTGYGKPAKTFYSQLERVIETKMPRVETKVHSIDITPSMKKSVMEEGQALFEHPEQYQNVKMRYFNGEGQLVREEQLNFLKSEKEVSNGKGIPDRGREAGVAPTLNGRSLWKSPAALKFKKDGYLVMPDQKIEGPEDVAFAFQFLKDAAQEHFYIVPVKDGQALAAELITIGTYNSAQPAIYEILGLLEKTGADSVYMVHNHPNGRMEPSSDDMKFTTRAMGVLDKIKVKFNGHIIIDTDKFVFIKSGQNRGLTADVIPHKQYARTRKVEVLKKYMEWSAGKESTPQIKKADDIYEVIKGITVDPKSGIVVLLNNQMRIMNMYAMPQDKINANEIMRLSARERTSAVITVNTGMDTLTTLDLMDDLNDVGMKLLDDIEVTAPGKYTSKQERGVLEAPEPYQGKIAEEGPKDIAPEDQFDALTPEEQAQFALEMDDLRKTPEGNLFIAIKRIGGIAPHRGGKLKEEYAEIPLFLKNNKGQPLDDFISQLQQYGWNFETENELIQEINRQAANPVEKVDRASLRKIIRDAQKNKRLKGTIKEKLFGKRRKFIQTVKDSENTKPEVAKAVESRYEPISNKETMTKAQAFVAESPDEAVQMIESNIKPDAFHNAVGIELIRIAQNEGRIQDAVRLVERMAEKQTALGQAIQALSMYNRLSPEGILMAAQRSIRRAKDTLPRHKVDQFEKLARDMKNPKDVEKLAKRMGVPHMTEDLAKDLVERTKKIGSAPQWEMPSVPEAKNAIQNLIDEFYSLGVEGQNNLPPEVKNAIQFTINEFEKLGVDGENTPIAKNAIQKIFKEFESLGVDGENTPMGPGIQQFMDIGRIKAARSGLIETALMLQKIQNQIPRTIWEKISMAQTIAQLLNPKTFIRNLLGNLIFQATENLADTVGAAIDIAVALNTGKRSVYLPNVKTQVKGAIQGFKEGYEEAVLGIDLKGQTLSKFTLPKNGVFNGGVMGGLEKTLRVALGATDRAFYQSAFNQSLEQQLKASGKKEIDEDMIERAHAIGLYRTFQDENILSRQFEQLKRWFNAGGKFGLGDVVLKYPRTPANLLHRGIEYSPFGFLHTVMRIADPLIFGKEFDQERFVRQTSRALTGSALLVGAGAVLAALGIISGKRSKDPDIVETRRNSGIREYQINTSALKRFIMSGMNPDQAKMQEGDTLVSYDWMQPASIGIALGANMVLDPRTNLVDKTVNFADSMLQASETLQEQPLVRGVKTFTSRRNIAEGLSEVVKDMPASFVPTILNQVRQLTDNIARNTQDPNYLAEAGKKVAMRIPGASRALPAQINTLGEARQMYQDDSNSIFNVFFNPAFVSRYRPDPVSKMVLDIWGKTGETVQFPRTAPRSVKVPDSTEPLVLDPEQYQLFASYIGKKTNVLFNMKLEDPVFMALPDTEKAKKLESYLTDIKQAAMIDVLGIRPKGTDRGTMYIIKQIKTDLEKIKANEEDGIDFQPYSDVPEGFR